MSDSSRLGALSRRKYKFVREYAQKLLLFTHDEPDADGRKVGLDYGTILDRVHRRRITYTGPFIGRLSTATYRWLYEIARELSEEGAILPSRPRRTRSDKIS